MKLSYNKLFDYISKDLIKSPEQIKAALNQMGMEVEDMLKPYAVYENIITAKLVEFNKIDGSDKLYLGKFDFGVLGIKDIIFGSVFSLNINEVYTMALPGIVLPTGIKVKDTKIMGIATEGMICSEQELGTSFTQEGLLRFPSDTKLGEPFMNILDKDLKNDEDTIFDMEITPNRPDQLGYLGIIREILPVLTEDNIDILDKIETTKYSPSRQKLKNICSNQTDCEIFLAREIKGLKVGQSPKWLKEFLTKNDVQSVNNVVDITNYCMLELGQPMHAYDKSKIDTAIQVRDAIKGEKLICLDGKEREMIGTEMIIGDEAGNALSLAGIIGGETSSISVDTVDIHLESAFFKPTKVRASSKLHKISTDASYRFERGTDPLMTYKALDRATDMILEMCGGEVKNDYIWDQLGDITRVINLEKTFITRLLGINLEEKFIISTLEKLGFSIIKDDGKVLKVSIPSRRIHDVKYDACLVEEIAKVYNYDKVPEIMPIAQLSMPTESMEQNLETHIQKFFVENGFNQVINFGFFSPTVYQDFDTKNNPELESFIEVEAPLGEEYSVMRTSLIPGLIKNYKYNLYRGESNFKFFEISNVFFPGNGNIKYNEIKKIGGLISATIKLNSWKHKFEVIDIYDLKSIIAGLFDALGINKKYLDYRKSEFALLEKGYAIDIFLNNKNIGYLGRLDKQGYKVKKEKNPVYVFELDFENIVNLFADVQMIEFQKLSKFPSTFRDVALVCDKNFESKQIIDYIYSQGKNLIVDVELFDAFEGKSIQEGKISLAFNMEFNSPERSLTNEEVGDIFDNIIVGVQKQFPVKLRE